MSKTVSDAVTIATKPLEEALQALRDELRTAREGATKSRESHLEAQRQVTRLAEMNKKNIEDLAERATELDTLRGEHDLLKRLQGETKAAFESSRETADGHERTATKYRQDFEGSRKICAALESEKAKMTSELSSVRANSDAIKEQFEAAKEQIRKLEAQSQEQQSAIGVLTRTNEGIKRDHKAYKDDAEQRIKGSAEDADLNQKESVSSRKELEALRKELEALKALHRRDGASRPGKAPEPNTGRGVASASRTFTPHANATRSGAAAASSNTPNGVAPRSASSAADASNAAAPAAAPS